LALPPSFLLDAALYKGPESPWCLSMQTKRGFVAVCKRWYHIGMPILYEEVVLRRMTQLPALLRTVELPDANFGHLVKRVDIKCYVPPDELPFLDSQFLRLFDKCPNVVWVGYDAITSPEPLKWTCAFQRLTAFSNLFPKLTRLECGTNVDFGNLVGVLQKCNSLESLTCHLQLPSGEPVVHDLPQVDLPNLKALSCYDTGTEYLASIASQWSMPNLEQLSAVALQLGMPDNVYKTTTDLLRAHGLHLKFLHLLQLGPETQDFLGHCPSLKHLVLSPNSSHPTSHPKITWVDIWSPGLDLRNYKALRKSLPAAFPSLRGVRQLDASLCTVSDLPSMLQDPENDASYFKYNFPGISIIYKAKAFIKTDMMENLADYDGPPKRYNSDESEEADESEDFESDCRVDRYWVDDYQRERSYDDTSDPWYTDESSPDNLSSTDEDDDIP